MLKRVVAETVLLAVVLLSASIMAGSFLDYHVSMSTTDGVVHRSDDERSSVHI